MQRQSLGSPVPKLHIHGGQREDTWTAEDSRRRESASLSSSAAAIDYDDHDLKAPRPRRLTLQSPLSPSHSKPEKLVHVIPVLTLLCFLILYLTSHTPSQTDLANISGFKRSTKHLDSAEISDDGQFMELRRGDALAIRSLRNLQKIEKNASRSRSHRKMADF